MAPARHRALLIGNSEFPRDAENLRPLKGPPNDVLLLEDALIDAETGLHSADDVEVLREATKQEILECVERFFAEASRDDQMLLYYTGHGRLGLLNEFYLCARDTRTDLLYATAVAVRDLSEIMDRSVAPATVVLLDCCHSGSFKGADNVPRDLRGEGRFVLASSRPGELAPDATKLGEASPFTYHVAEALRLGTLDADRDGFVTVDDVYRYVRERLRELRASTPERSFGGAVDDVALARARPVEPVVERGHRAATPADGGLGQLGKGPQDARRRRRRVMGASALASTLVAAGVGLTIVVARLQSPITTFPVPGASTGTLGDIAAGRDGNLWFTDSYKLGRITPTGRVAELDLGSHGLYDPTALAFDPDGNRWVTDGADKIGRVTPRGAVTVFAIPTANSDSMAIAAGPDGNLWFTETLGDKVGRITRAGQMTEFPLGASASPGSIVAGSDGNLWFAVSGGIARITPAGQVKEFNFPAGLSDASGMAGGPDGNVWFTDTIDNKIGRITPRGAFRAFVIPTENSDPEGIAAGHDGNLWFTESASARIGRITPAGQVTEFPLAFGVSPGHITAGPGNSIWFTESAVHEIGRIDT